MILPVLAIQVSGDVNILLHPMRFVSPMFYSISKAVVHIPCVTVAHPIEILAGMGMYPVSVQVCNRWHIPNDPSCLLGQRAASSNFSMICSHKHTVAPIATGVVL